MSTHSAFGWRETYEGGSPEAEAKIFAQLAIRMMRLQQKMQKKHGDTEIRRGFQAKRIAATSNAVFRFRDDLPKDLCCGYAQPGRSYPAIVRFSNAHSAHQPDHKPDMRGLALRITVSGSEHHDLLMTNAPAVPASTASQFMDLVEAGSGGFLSQAFGFTRLSLKYGPFETWRMIQNVLSGRNRKVESLAAETYWSRGASRWGETLAVRYLARGRGARATTPPSSDDDYLRSDIAVRLKSGAIDFDLFLQCYVDEKRTPVENAAVEWKETVSPPVFIGTMTLPQQDILTPSGGDDEAYIERLAFSPWNTSDLFRPLGNINRARKAVYDASAAYRLGHRWPSPIPWRNRVFGAVNRAVFRAVNRVAVWHKLPHTPSLLNLIALRQELRSENLIDTEFPDAPPATRPVQPVVPPEFRTARSYDGTFNDVSEPKMGAVGAAFGRNMPPVYRPDLFDDPCPVTVSRELLYRDAFIPAPSLNIIAAAWIQFQVHDWVHHARYALGEHDVRVPLPPGMTWSNRPGEAPGREMRIAGEKYLAGGTDATHAPVTFGNAVSHWWDGSEVYGANAAGAALLREELNGHRGAKIRLDNGYLPVDVSGREVTGFTEGWWLGLSAMHTLFAREHNAVCDALKAEHRDWSDERVYQTARLVISALIAKIHTIEWTPGILATKALDVAMNSNWSGASPKEWLARLGAWLLDINAISGIPGTLPDHHGTPFSLTEEFSAVYRMHPLIPDDYTFFNATSGAKIRGAVFADINAARADDVMRDIGLADTLYSFGVSHPGAIVLHNYPKAFRVFERDGELVDLAVVDLVRTRRRGVPRYNDFRAGFHMKPVTRWDDICDNPDTVKRMRDVYRGRLDLVDTMTGLFAETPPRGFGFSDTAFRVFLLMASRRLQSDRFLTVDYRPEIYSELGLRWIAGTGMKDVITRHCPGLADRIPANAFAPWKPASPVKHGAGAG